MAGAWLNEELRNAYHEAGHAVIMWLVGGCIIKATIKPFDEERAALGGYVLKGPGGFTTAEPFDPEAARMMPCPTPAKEQRTFGLLYAVTTVAGPIAETEAGFDPRRPYLLTEFLRGTRGYLRSDEPGTRREKLVQVRACARALLRRHWALVARLASLLYLEGTVTGDRIDRELRKLGGIPLAEQGESEMPDVEEPCLIQ